MSLIFYITNYFFWHYTKGIKDLISVWVDFVWFTFNYFSVGLLAKTLFYPWKRLGEERKGFFDFTFIVIDLFMRLFGALARTLTIIVGLLAVMLVIVLGVVSFAGWVLWPAIIALLFLRGFSLLLA